MDKEDREWDGWMASLTRWTWVWTSSGSWWWTGKPGVLQSMGSQRIGHDWVTELIHTHTMKYYSAIKKNEVLPFATIWDDLEIIMGFPDGAMVKYLPASTGDARDTGSIPGLGRSPGVGNGNPPQYSCLENSVDRGAWWATVHGVTKSRTWLNINADIIILSEISQKEKDKYHIRSLICRI